VNDNQINELLTQLKRIADGIEQLQDSDLGSLAGIEMNLCWMREALEGKSDGNI
jgi:hypothetical protein